LVELWLQIKPKRSGLLFALHNAAVLKTDIKDGELCSILKLRLSARLLAASWKLCNIIR